MSVLNKMLRDLEQRQQSSSAAPDNVIAAQASRPLWLTLLLLLCVLLLCFAVYAILTRSQPPVTLPPVIESRLAQPPDIVTLRPDPAMQQASAHPTITAVAETLAPLVEPVKQTDVEIAPPVVIPVATTVATQASDETSSVVLAAPALVEVQRMSDNVEPAHTSLQIKHSVSTLAQRSAGIQQQAIAATNAGKLQQALQLWQQLQQLTPADPSVYLAQARILTQLGQTEQARLTLRQALSQNITHADIQLLLAQYAVSSGDWQQVNILLPAHFALATQPEYYGLKATALQQLGQQYEALQWFTQLVQLQPQQARWWLGAAIAHDALAQKEQAHLHYQQALNWGDSLSVASRNYIKQRLAATE